VGSFQLFHGSPLDEDEYLVSSSSAAEATPYLEAAVSFFGHTHLQGGFLCHRNGARRIEKLPPECEHRVLELDPDGWYLLNPGSVGQPRDGDPRAAYAVFDEDRRLLEYRRVRYPIQTTQAKIIRAGLPDVLAYRLSSGT
jgi:diadenosine tetraphosphatase ApaH/serine/threonine PP2A family protein phosphatase